MVIKCEETLKRFEGMVKTIADAYEEHLNNRSIYSMKLGSLEVKISVSKTELTSGLTRRIGNKSQMFLNINEDNGDEYIAFIIAHEFAHFLFQKVTDCLYLTGVATDGSADFTAITRINEEGNLYGRELEEQCADILALYVIKLLSYNINSKTLASDLKKTEKARYMVEKLIDVFGEDVNNHDKIDYFRIGDSYGYVANSFWYHVITFSFSEIVKLYDKVIGEGSFQKFCKTLDDFENKKTDFNELAIDIEKLRKAGKVA